MQGSGLNGITLRATLSDIFALWNYLSEPIDGPWRQRKKKGKWQNPFAPSYRAHIPFARGRSRWNTPIPCLCNRKHREERRRVHGHARTSHSRLASYERIRASWTRIVSRLVVLLSKRTKSELQPSSCPGLALISRKQLGRSTVQ